MRLLVLLLAACGAAPSESARVVVAKPVAVADAAIDAATVIPARVWRRDEIVGSTSACALREDDRVMCWGANSYGEVGDKPGTPHPVPILVPGVHGATSLAAGPSSTCAIAGGRVMCWGGFDATKVAVHEVPGVTGVVELAVASQHACARAADGAVTCWGAGDAEPLDALGHARQLAAGYALVCALGTDDRVRCNVWYPRAAGEASAEIEVTDVRGATSIAAFYNQACAIVGGRVTCWTIDGTVPRLDNVRTIDGVTDATDIVVGLSEVCVARASGASCWNWSQLVPADELRGFRSLALGMSVHCGVRSDDTPACWGDDSAIGRRSLRGASITPVDVDVDAVELSVERERSCVRRRGDHVACWTTAEPGDIGVAADHLAAGAFFTCAIKGKDVSCIGAESWVGCQWESEDNCQGRTFLRPTRVDGLLGLRDAVALADPCAILADGTVACREVATASAQTVARAGISHAVSISPWCAVDKRGAVTCWRNPTPARIANVDAVEVASGRAHDCVRTRDNHVACWGANQLGELGDGTRTSRDKPVVVLDDVVQLAAGDRATCALKKGGAIACWGSNASGALGDGSGRDQLKPVPVSGISDAVEVRMAGERVCARRKSGKVACWGHTRPDAIVEVPMSTPSLVVEPESIE